MVGKIVRHIRYGQGVVREYAPPYMKIAFESAGIEKRFAYPLVFESFLRFEDPELQASAEEAIAGIRAEEARMSQARELSIRQKEAEMLESHKAELKAKRAAAAKKAAGTRAANRRTAKQA